jgi:hypothetical protein
MATDKLVQFATKGFVIDADQLKAPDARDRVAELRDHSRYSFRTKPMFIASF